MARYINVDDVNLKGIAVFDENLDVLIPLSEVRNALLMTPTADVVSKERLEAAIGRLDETEIELDAMRGAANSYKMHYENLAREIFAEIDDLMIDHARGDIDDHWLFVRMEEIKKKYTEGMVDEQRKD